MDPSTATSMTRTPRSSTSTSRISPGPGNGSRRTSSWRRPGRRGSSGESSISPTSRSVPQPNRYPMTAAEFHDRTWLPANRAESHRDHGMNRPGRSGIEAGAMNQITPTPANHDRPRPRLPEAGAGREVTGRRRSLLTAAIGRVSAGGRSLWPVGVRCAAAIVFLIFGVSKLVNHAAELASFRHYPVPAPGTFVYAVGVIEISGGLLLAIGLLTRLTALALAADMLGAIVVSGLARWETVSLTLAPMLLAAMIILIRSGAGDWSLDRHMAANMSRRCAAFLLIFSGCPSFLGSAAPRAPGHADLACELRKPY